MPEISQSVDYEYYLMMCESLRVEINETTKTIWEIERNTLLIAGGIWAWRLANNGPKAVLISWVPLVLTVLFGLRSLSLYQHISRISSYLHTQEVEMIQKEGLRWETYFRNKHPRATMTVYLTFILWIALIIACGIAPLILH